MDKLNLPLTSPVSAWGLRLPWKSRKAPPPDQRKKVVSSADPQSLSSTVEAVTSARSSRATSLNILVADDNAVNRQLMRHILEKANFRVAVASTGGEALSALLDSSFDLVIMDVQMPEMDGLQATAAIRSGMVQGIDAALPVIAVSANTFPEDRLKCLQAGMNDFVPKPFSSSELLGVVQKYGKLPPSDASEVLVDRQQVLNRLGDPDLLELVCSAFLRDTPLLMASLQKAITEGALPEAERYAHSLKGYAANVGADALRQAAFEMEAAAERGNLDGLRSMFTNVSRLAEAVMEILDQRKG